MGHTKSFFYIIRAWMIGILMLVMTGMFVYADIPVIETDVTTPSTDGRKPIRFQISTETGSSSTSGVHRKIRKADVNFSCPGRIPEISRGMKNL